MGNNRIQAKGASDIVAQVHQAATKRILFVTHAIRQMARADRMISPAEVRLVVTKGILIEDYPEDVRGHSCLLLGYGDGGRVLHVVCCPKADYLAVITAYVPDARQWSKNFTRRCK